MVPPTRLRPGGRPAADSVTVSPGFGSANTPETEIATELPSCEFCVGMGCTTTGGKFVNGTVTVSVVVEVPPWPSEIVYVTVVLPLAPGAKPSKALPGSNVYDPFGLITNVPPLVPAIGEPATTLVAPLPIVVTESASPSASVSFCNTPTATPTEMATCGLVALASLDAIGLSFWP